MPHRPAAHRAPTPRPARLRRRSVGGHRKAGGTSRRALPLSALLGSAALLVAGIGAVSLGEPGSPVGVQALTAGPRAGMQAVAWTDPRPSDSLYRRQPVRVSRGSARPPLGGAPALQSAAEAQAAARAAQLRATAAQARTYAQDLDDARWVLPTTGFHISTWFGQAGWQWASGYHTGIDFATACGTPIVAVTGGTVAQAGWDGPYGNQVRETLPNGDQVWYNHMTLIRTGLHATLGRGGLVGLVGETGNAYGCHVHIEYRMAADLETAVDPAPFFAAHGLPLS